MLYTYDIIYIVTKKNIITLRRYKDGININNKTKYANWNL